jgi:hypothetical protein
MLGAICEKETPERQVPAPAWSTPAYLNWGLCQAGGEWLRSVGCWLAPLMPGLIWVRDLVVGDVMVDRSVRVE